MKTRARLLLLSLLFAASAAAWTQGETVRCAKPLDVCLEEKRALLAKRGVLGFLWSEVGKDDPAPPGARYVVRSVPPGYPAHSAGLKVGDVLLAIEGRSLAQVSREEVDRLLQRIPAGKKAGLQVLRGGRTLPLSIVAAKPPRESVEAWIGQHVRAEHSAEDYRQYLRQTRKAQPRSDHR